MGFFNNTRKKQEQEIVNGSGKVIAFLNQKGGVGKTTMAFNTAHALANSGKKVLCIDMDPQSNLSLLCGVDCSETDDFHIFNLLVNSVRELKQLHVGAMLSDVIVEGDLVDVIPAGQELSGFELSVAGISSPRQLILKKFLEKNMLTNEYDYIIVDCPPTLGLLVVNVLCAANGVIVPFKPDEFSRKGLGHFYNALADIEDMGVTSVPEVLAHVPNLVDNRRKQEGSDLAKITQELEDSFGDARLVQPFFNRTQLVKSGAQRKSVFDFKSKEFAPLQDQFNQIATIIEDWSYEARQ
jgi:chromosome partitioning protein